jgi:hypothetical protein
MDTTRAVTATEEHPLENIDEPGQRRRDEGKIL